MPNEGCPECGQVFEAVWGVTIGDTGDYKPVFGGPVAFDKAQCHKCHLTFERSGGGPWLREGAK